MRYRFAELFIALGMIFTLCSSNLVMTSGAIEARSSPQNVAGSPNWMVFVYVY